MTALTGTSPRSGSFFDQTLENHGHAELSAEMLGIGGDGGERLGRRAEQDRVDHGLVLESDLADRCRQGEDDVDREARARSPGALPGSALRLRNMFLPFLH